MALVKKEGSELGKEHLTPKQLWEKHLSAAGGDRETSLSLPRHQETF